MPTIAERESLESLSTSWLIKSKLATQYIFLICGIGLSSWATMVPFAKERLALNDAGLGLLLLLLGAGAITMMPIASIFIHRYGSRIITILSALLMAICLPLLMIVQNQVLMGLVLFMFGAGIGAMDVAMNAHGIHIQKLLGKPIMSAIHGMFSVGGLLGSIGLGFLIQLGLTPIAAALSIAILLVLIICFQYRYFLDGKTEKEFDQTLAHEKTLKSKGPFAWLKKSIILLGILCFIVFLAEGAILDWGAIFLNENRAVPIEWAGIGYASFSVAMATMRLIGDRIITRFNSKTVVVFGSLLAAFGLFLAVFTPWLLTALVGFILLGIGAANIVPVFFSVGGSIKEVPVAIGISAITTFGYAGQLVGPAALGYIAKYTSVPTALCITAMLLLLVAISYQLWPVHDKMNR